MCSRRSWLVYAAAFALTVGALCAQEGYRPADIQTGKQLYRVNCTHCHGPNGDSVSGVDLGHGTFKATWSFPPAPRLSRERRP